MSATPDTAADKTPADTGIGKQGTYAVAVAFVFL